MSFFKGKRGNAVADTLMIIIGIFVFALCTILGIYILDTTNTEINADPDMANVSKEMITEQTARYPSVFDSGFMIIFIGLWLAALVSAFTIDSHPIFFALSIILLLAAFVTIAYIGNSYETTMAEPMFSGFVASFPMMHYIMTHLLLVGVVVSASIMLVLFGKSRFM